MKILLTGATGVIGTEIITLCLQKHYQVHYLTTDSGKIRSSEGVQGFYWNPQRGEMDMKSMEGIDAIINLAGATIAKRWTTAYREKILHSRIAALQLLDKAIGALGPHRKIAVATASAIGIYPDSLTRYYEENSAEIAPSFLGNVVMQWEQAADSLKKRHVSVAKIRTGMVLSRSGGALPTLVKAITCYAGALFGSGDQWRSWIHSEDIARLFLFAVEEQWDGVYNGVAPNPVTQRKLLKETAAILKKPLLLPAIPAGILKLIFGERAYLLCSSQRVSAKKIEKKGFPFHFKTIHTALNDLL
jgi:uncharacterized protein